MKKIIITQVKSSIDRPERQKLTLRALGLNKMNSSREVEATDQILGMVRKVNHLIKIEESSVQPVEASVLQTPETLHFTKLPLAEIPQPSVEEPVEDVTISDEPVASTPQSWEGDVVSQAPSTEIGGTEEETKA